MLPSSLPRHGLGLIAVLASAAALAPAAATAGAPRASSAALEAGRLKYGADVTTDQAIRAYWTLERMRAAKPADAEAPKRSNTVRSAPVQTGQALTVAPKAPMVARAAQGSDPRAVLGHWDHTHYTARTVGKVFFTLGGGDSVCSGAIVTTEGANAVWSAAHCMHGGGPRGGYATNWAFVPAYDDDLPNPRPYGTWTARRLVAASGWVSRTDWNEDMGVALMNPLAGRRIADDLGAQGFAAFQSRRAFQDVMGYPHNPPFDGGNLWRCFGFANPRWRDELAQQIEVPCHLTAGASGSPWLLQYNGIWGYVNGVVSESTGPTMTTSYFDDTAVRLYEATRWG
jgi:hypothetical protein